MNATSLTPDQRLRYSRQRILPTIGDDGQLRICNAIVAVPLAMHPHELAALTYLVAGGVGRLYLIAPVDTARAQAWRHELAALRPDARVDVAPSATSVPPGAHHINALPTALDDALVAVAQLLKALAAA